MAKKTEKKDKKATGTERLVISEPNLEIGKFRVRGDAMFVQHRFSQKAKLAIKERQEAGSTGKKGKKKEKKDFQALYEGAMYRGEKGEYGIPCSAFRSAMISACRMAGFQMTRAKLSIFVVPDVIDATDGTQLVKITKGKPEYREDHVRLATGVVDVSPRPAWAPGWEAEVTVRYDADQFTASDVANLLMRAGLQVGVGEGRPDSKNSAGMGWGTFEVL
jgi:hypothetical protein